MLSISNAIIQDTEAKKSPLLNCESSQGRPDKELEFYNIK